MDRLVYAKGLGMERTIVEIIAVTAHSEPVGPLSVELAHRVMQVHAGCAADCCPNKKAAYDILVTAGHIVPDSSRNRAYGVGLLRRSPRRQPTR
ncbi:hypothetical protein [Nocardia thraciensis]